jgi:hypothetical protein
MGENSVTAKEVREPQGYNSKQGCGTQLTPAPTINETHGALSG